MSGICEINVTFRVSLCHSLKKYICHLFTTLIKRNVTFRIKSSRFKVMHGFDSCSENSNFLSPSIPVSLTEKNLSRKVICFQLVNKKIRKGQKEHISCRFSAEGDLWWNYSIFWSAYTNRSCRKLYDRIYSSA